MKVCNKCHKEKDESEFAKRSESADGLQPTCKACRSKGDKKRAAKYHKEHPEIGRNNNLRRNYGITLPEYEALFMEQNGNCAICDRNQSQFVNPLVVDHDHQTGKVRKLLCPACNTAIGLFGDDPAVLDKAAAYLRTMHAKRG